VLQIVEHDGYILEKPDDVEHARKVLERCAVVAGVVEVYSHDGSGGWGTVLS
jgi:predicted house-cleaning NTP pyrophosphatase (Maf/HAM1 superfamily)